MELSITKKQHEFISSDADEVLFGGAAGGGKSYGQLVDALLYALKFKGSKQLILRRTMPELEKSLIRTALKLFPRDIFTYKSSSHVGVFSNGSLIDFAYCDNENDVFRYQSAEYDVIRFDELTHFSQDMYLYLMSRLRGANGFPKQMKSSTNPGGIGHQWVKARFIDSASPNEKQVTKQGSRVFIPSLVQDNSFLMASDPDYLRRLENLNEKDKRALLHGDWDIFEGQYFHEFRREIHVCKHYEPPSNHRRYRVLDYGLDMLACYWIAVDEQKRGYVYKELYESGLIISQAAERILEVTGEEEIYLTLAPPDLWNRRQETGRSVAEWFYDFGVPLCKTSNNRVEGWLAIKEWLKPFADCDGEIRARILISEGCRNLIRTLPAVQFDRHNSNDVADNPHELTHAPDALRYFCAYHLSAARKRVGGGNELELPFNFGKKSGMQGDTVQRGATQIGKGERVNVI